MSVMTNQLLSASRFVRRVAPVGFNVQRGETVMDDLTFRSVELDTPVPVGKAWAHCIARGVSGLMQNRRLFVKCELTDIVNGQYTKLELTKAEGVSEISVTFEVIWGDVFNVQQIPIVFEDGVGLQQQELSPVDLGKSFIIHSTETGGTNVSTRINVRASFDDNETLRMERVAAVNEISCVAFVVEWSGASVQPGDVRITDNQNGDSIAEVDLDKSFIVASWWEESASTNNDRFRVEGWFEDNESVLFDRAEEGGAVQLHYFVVSHPDISTQQIRQTVTGTTASPPIDTVELDKSFLAPFSNLGNHSATRAPAAQAFLSRKLLPSQVDLIRQGDQETCDATIFVVSST